MATDLPDAMGLREIKYGQRTSDRERVRIARRLLEAGRLAEALDLFLIAGDEEGIDDLESRARKEGRPILFVMMLRAGRDVAPASWQAAGHAAMAAGRWREAFRAFTEAGDEEGLAKVREQIPEYESYVPQGK